MSDTPTSTAELEAEIEAQRDRLADTVDQLSHKLSAVQKFQSHTVPELLDGERTRVTARLYDALGNAEYEAIEAFRRWEG